MANLEVSSSCCDTRRCRRSAEDQQTFYSLLAEEMIDNNIDSRARGSRNSAEQRATFTSPNLIKTTCVKRKRIGDASLPTSHTQQGYCKACNRKVTTICNACLETSGKEMFFCNPVSTNQNCFLQHKLDEH
jgi:hypothetical protein